MSATVKWVLRAPDHRATVKLPPVPPMRAFRAGTGVEEAASFRRLLYQLLIAAVVMLFIGPLGTVAGHYLANTSAYFEYVWWKLDHGLTERNPSLCRMFNLFTYGELERWFVAARWLNIIRSAALVTTDFRAAAGLCCGGLFFRLGQIAGRAVPWLVAATFLEKVASRAGELYRLLSRQLVDSSTGDQPAGRLVASKVARQVLLGDSTAREESLAEPRYPPRVADIPSRESFVSAWYKETELRDPVRRSKDRRLSPVVIYCLGLDAALRQQRRQRRGSTEEAREVDSHVGTPPETTSASAAEKTPLHPAILLVAAKGEAARKALFDSSTQGEVYIDSPFGTAWLAPVRGRQGLQDFRFQGETEEARHGGGTRRHTWRTREPYRGEANAGGRHSRWTGRYTKTVAPNLAAAKAAHQPVSHGAPDLSRL